MRIFLTGATGFVGSAVAAELTEAGHHVVGLARSDGAAVALAGAGVEVHRGALEDVDSLRRAAAEADGVIHTGFVHDFSRLDEAGRIDQRAIAALGEALAGSDRPLVVASARGLVAGGRVATERDAPDPDAPGAHRLASELTAVALAEHAVRSSVVRLPSSVHGAGDHGFVPALIGVAREKGVSAFIGDGSNRWPAVHRLDAARLFRLALEDAPAGAVLHGIDEEGVALRDIAEAIAWGLGVPAVPITADKAAEHFGWLAGFAGADLPASSALTRARTGWRPVQPGLLADLGAGHYFREAHAAAA